MDETDNEEYDEWVESYDSFDTDEEFEDDKMKMDYSISKKKLRTKQNRQELIGLSTEETDNESNEESSNNESNDGDTEECKDKTAETDDGKNLLKANPGWADAISKILKSNKPKKKKILVLSRAKRLSDVKSIKKSKLDFEIVDEQTGGVKEEINSDEEDKKPILGNHMMIKECQTVGRVKPSILDKDREKMLSKVATRGVVQLFNVVRQQQKTVDKKLTKAGKSHRRKEKTLEKIDKQEFLNVLTGSVKSMPVDSDIAALEKKNRPMWQVLSDDFLMGAKLKDWDKKEDTQEDEEMVNIEE